jgi:PAS domain S-box-containing protein
MAGPDETAARLAAIVTSSDDAIVSTDVTGIVTTWNAAAERLFGFTAREMIGQPIKAIVPPDRWPEEDGVLARVRDGLRVAPFETIRRRKDGSAVEVALTVSPIRTQDGRIIGASKIARDITERRLMERHAFRLAAIVESSDDAIVGKDLNGIVQSWNRGAERIFGYTAEEMIGRPITVVIPEDRLDEEAHVLTQIRAGGGVRHFETVRRRKDGQLIDVSLTVSPIRTRTGAIIGASKVARDITEQKRLSREVEQASRAKDEFLATLSHELRTPLNTVLGYTDMLQSGMIAWEDRAKALNAIIRNAEALRQLVNDVLDTSQIVTGNIRLKIEPCDISTVAEEAIETVRPATLAKSIEIRTRIAHGLMVQGDCARLRQVLWNLLSNAVKFTPEGGTLTVAADAEPRHVRIAVEDTGVGIEREALPHVFERFWQGDGTHTRSHGGLGLGLALVRHFVELHGGKVTAHSEGRDRGTRFEVILPAAAVHA